MRVQIAVDNPSLFRLLRSIGKALWQTKRPNPVGAGVVDHQQFQPVLEALAEGGLASVSNLASDISSYLGMLSTFDPDSLTRDETLAFWINFYNAGAVALAVQAFHLGEQSILRVPSGFSRPLVTIAGERLSLDAVEHGKIRRLGDPRIHGALVCGSLSCPTLRSSPYTGDGLSGQLDDQLRAFLAGGGASAVDDDTVALSRVFLWYGSDFVRPNRMPTFIPTTRKKILRTVRPWLPPNLQGRERVSFQDYDWGLACAVR